MFFKKLTICAYFHTTVAEIKLGSVILNSSEWGNFDIPNDFVLALTGYEPDFEFLQRLKIKIDQDEFRTPSHDPHTYESCRPGVYLAGVVVGGMYTNKWFIENSRDHATAIFDHLSGTLTTPAA